MPRDPNGSDKPARFPNHSTEHERVHLLRSLFAGLSSDGVVLGIGDDAALLEPRGETLVWSIDAQVEEVHFRRAWMSLCDVGYRAMMAAVSDLAAMGSRPIGALSALVLPLEVSDEELCELARGQREAAAECACPVLGGNMTRGDVLSITTSVLGAATHPLLRSGARAGDRIWLTGHLGRAAAGLSLRMRNIDLRSESDRVCDLAFRRPRAETTHGMAAARARASAAVDVSDGLVSDLGHLARDSGVAAVLEEPSLGDPVVEQLANQLRLDPLELVLSGGEDYALIVTAPADVELAGFRCIGRIVDELSPGVWLESGAAPPRRLHERGFDHFRTPGS